MADIAPSGVTCKMKPGRDSQTWVPRRCDINDYASVGSYEASRELGTDGGYGENSWRNKCWYNMEALYREAGRRSLAEEEIVEG